MDKTILVIDDEEDLRLLISLIAESAGYQVLQACDGITGLQIIAEQSVDLVVLDVMMPGIDGWEVCRQIKGNMETRHIPVIILTVRNRPIDKVVGTEVVHADGYLTKPFERIDLLAAIARLLDETDKSTTEAISQTISS